MKDTIIIKYNKKEEDSIRIFGEQFVKNNKDILKMKINGKIRVLNEFFSDKIIINDIEIILAGIERITDMSYMFCGCSSLLSLPDSDKWNTSNVKDMSSMFSGCSSLSSLPDISKWDTSNVRDMNSMFSGCASLSSLPDISKWNTLMLLI